MRKLTMVIALFTTLSYAFAQLTGTTLSIEDYVKHFLTNSAVLDAATGAAEQAGEALESANLSQESAYNLGLLRNGYQYARAELLTSENNEVIHAFQLVFSLTAAEKSFIFTEISEAIAAEEYKRAEELAEMEYISGQDKRAAQIAYLHASSDTRAAAAAVLTAWKALTRPIERDLTLEKISPFPVSALLPSLPELERLAKYDNLMIKVRADLALHTGRRDHLSASQAVSQAELEALEQTIEQLKRSERERLWFLQDALDQLHSEIEDNSQAMIIAELNAETKLQELQQARHQYDKGDLHLTSVTQAELSHRMALEELASLERAYFILVLEVRKLSKESLLEWVGETFSR